jgi:hypothetical protein
MASYRLHSPDNLHALLHLTNLYVCTDTQIVPEYVLYNLFSILKPYKDDSIISNMNRFEVQPFEV